MWCDGDVVRWGCSMVGMWCSGDAVVMRCGGDGWGCSTVGMPWGCGGDAVVDVVWWGRDVVRTRCIGDAVGVWCIGDTVGRRWECGGDAVRRGCGVVGMGEDVVGMLCGGYAVRWGWMGMRWGCCAGGMRCGGDGWGCGGDAVRWGCGAVGRTRCGGAAASCQPRLCPATRPRSICRSRNEPSRPLAQASSRSPIHPHPPFSFLLFFPNGLTMGLPVAFTAALRPAGGSRNLCFKLKGLL